MNAILLAIAATIVIGAGAGYAAFEFLDPESPQSNACRTLPLAEETGSGLVRFRIDNRGPAKPVTVCVLTEGHKKIAVRNVTVPGGQVTEIDLKVPIGSYWAQLEWKMGQGSGSGTSHPNLIICPHRAARLDITLIENGISVSGADCFDASKSTQGSQNAAILPAEDPFGPAGPAIGFGVATAGLAALAIYYRGRLHYAGLLLFTRLARPQVLQLETRARIHELVSQEPGIHAKAIADRLDLAPGETLYHLHVLTREKILVRVGNWGLRSFFVAGRYAPPQMRAMAALRSHALDRLYQAIRRQPGASLPNVALLAGCSVGRASRLSRRLEEVGLIERRASGRGLVLLPRASFEAMPVLSRAN